MAYLGDETMLSKMRNAFDNRYNLEQLQLFTLQFTIFVLILFVICLLIPRIYALIFVIPIGEEIGKSMFVLLANKQYRKYFYPLAIVTALAYAAIEVAIRGGSQNLIIGGLVLHPLLALITVTFYKSDGYTWKGYAVGILVTSAMHGMFNWMLNW